MHRVKWKAERAGSSDACYDPTRLLAVGMGERQSTGPISRRARRVATRVVGHDPLTQPRQSALRAEPSPKDKKGR